MYTPTNLDQTKKYPIVNHIYPGPQTGSVGSLLMLPNRGRGFGNEPYMIRRRWDYFVRNLLGVEPPKEYQLREQSRPN